MNEQDNSPSQRPAAGGGHRLHMGTACSDPSYLPLTPQEQARERAYAREQAAREQRPARTADGHRSLRHSERYLQTPKPGHAIFTSQRDRRARRAKLAIVAVAVAAIAIALVWFFVLR